MISVGGWCKNIVKSNFWVQCGTTGIFIKSATIFDRKERRSDMSYDSILYEEQGEIGILTLNMPEKRNALGIHARNGDDRMPSGCGKAS